MKSLKYLFLLSVGLLMNSCSDEISGTEWAPGEVSDAPGVYFSADNETFMAILDDGGSKARLTVQRIDNKGDLQVPVIVKKSHENMVIPSHVFFHDGSYEATLEIDCSTVPAIVQHPLELTFPAEYLNPYAAGAPEYSGQLIVSRWENVSETGLTEFKVVSWSFKDEAFKPVESEMTHLLGSDRYRIKNFLNTGVDFTFELVKSPLKNGYYRIMPVSNQLLLADYGWGDYAYYNSWWLITDDFGSDDEDAEEWPDTIFYRLNGDPFTIYYIQFLWYDDATKTEYCYVMNRDSGNPTAYMAFYGNLDEDMETYSSYYRIRFEWNEGPTSEQ